MDLGLQGRFAVVTASSAGLGYACAAHLAAAGATVVVNGRDTDALQQAAERIRRQTGSEVIAVPGDVADAAVQQALVDAVPQVDILVNNNGGPPFRDFREVDRKAILAGVSANMATPIELVQRVIDGMIERRFGRIVNITSFSVKMPIAGLDLSSGARAGLTGFLAGVARDVAHANVTINFMMPGYFATGRLRSLQAREAEARGISADTVSAEGAERIPARRFGNPEEFGAACAFLCSQQAGYITGQSLLIDGGAYPGIL
ncbi:MAG: SDR family oxidoreductase [Microbacterium sp.]